MFHVSERNGVLLAASRRFAVSDTACCSFLTMQRYYISIAVYEYNGDFLPVCGQSCYSVTVWQFSNQSILVLKYFYIIYNMYIIYNIELKIHIFIIFSRTVTL